MPIQISILTFSIFVIYINATYIHSTLIKNYAIELQFRSMWLVPNSYGAYMFEKAMHAYVRCTRTKMIVLINGLKGVVIEMCARYILSSVCSRSSLLSQIYLMQCTVLCVASLPSLCWWLWEYLYFISLSSYNPKTLFRYDHWTVLCAVCVTVVLCALKFVDVYTKSLIWLDLVT